MIQHNIQQKLLQFKENILHEFDLLQYQFNVNQKVLFKFLLFLLEIVLNLIWQEIFENDLGNYGMRLTYGNIHSSKG